jgi:hypothetical protein
MRTGVVPALAIAMTMPAILSARSDEIPTLDVGPVCRGIASQSGDSLEAGLASTSEQCVQSEQVVREQLKKELSTFSAADKQHCVTLSKIGGESSYTELLTCLEMARDVRTYRAAASGKATTRTPSSSSLSSSSLSSLYLSSRSPSSRSPSSRSPSSPSPSSPSPSSPSTSMVQPGFPTNEPSKTMLKELQLAKVDAINARTSESMAQRKLADTEADLKQAKDEAARATKEAQQAKADAEADLKRAKEEAGRATKEAQQAKADVQVALQSKAEAERKLAASEATEKQKLSQTDPLGTWLRGLGAWLRAGLFGPSNPENP